MKTIKLNGEFTKEELESKLKEFDKNKWRIGTHYDDRFGTVFHLHLNDKIVGSIWDTVLSYQKNISNLVIKIAEYMGYLASKEQIFSNDEKAYFLNFYWDKSYLEVDDIYSVKKIKIIDTKEHAEEIKALIESSEDLMKEIFGGK